MPNWFTIIAQVINFLILVWLLKRFLYKPILHAIDEREKGIAIQLDDAGAKKAEAKKERDDLEHKNAAFDQERAALLKKATDEANDQRQRLLDEARKDADLLRTNRQVALRNEQRDLNQDIARWTQKEVFAITRKTLADLAATSIEERMVAVFIDRLQTLTGLAKEQLAAALKTSAQAARVRSAFDLPPEQRMAIQKALDETFAADVHLQFETAPELISGIELSSNGQKIAWSIEDYLGTLEKSASALLEKDSQPESKPDTNGKPAARAECNSVPKTVARPEPKPEPKREPKLAATAPKADR